MLIALVKTLLVRPLDDSREGLHEVLPENFLFFFFYQFIVLRSRAVQRHQMYFGGSVV